MSDLPPHRVHTVSLSASEIDAYVRQARRMRSQAIGDACVAGFRAARRAVIAVGRALLGAYNLPEMAVRDVALAVKAVSRTPPAPL